MLGRLQGACRHQYRHRVEALVADGTDEQKNRYLPGLASGTMTGCFALTERDAGSDAASLTTSARRDGDHFVLNGSKAFITNAPIADLFTVMARTDPSDMSARGISAFMVERNTPGLETGAAYRKMGQAGFARGRGAFARLPRAGEEPYRRR